MLVASSIRNQKEYRNRKNHMNALLEEIKVKGSIEGLDLEKKIYGSISEAILIERKNREKSREERSTQEPHQFMEWKQKSSKAKKSRASMKLEEIVQYAEKFPHPNLKKLIESRGSVQFKKITDAKRVSLSKFQHRRRCGFIFKKDDHNLTQPKINYELMLKFDMNNEILETECHTEEGTRLKELERKEKIKHLMELNKESSKREEDFSMRRFIEEGIEKELKRANRMERKTHNDKARKVEFIMSPEKSEPIDLREERMERVQKFIRGCSQQEKEEFSDYISMGEIQKNVQNFKTYANIYGRVKHSIAKEKMNPKLFREQSMRNVIYLTENLRQEGNMERKREIKLAMKRLKIAE